MGETEDLKRAARETDQSISDRQRKAVADDRDERAARLQIGQHTPGLNVTQAEADEKKQTAKKTTKKTAAKKAAKKTSR